MNNISKYELFSSNWDGSDDKLTITVRPKDFDPTDLGDHIRLLINDETFVIIYNKVFKPQEILGNFLEKLQTQKRVDGTIYLDYLFETALRDEKVKEELKLPREIE